MGLLSALLIVVLPVIGPDRAGAAGPDRARSLPLETPSLELAFRVRLDFGDGPRTRFAPAFKQFTRGFVS
jgi:hypothetical protein